MSRWWLAVVLIAALVREPIIRLGYSWITGTVVAVLMISAFFVFLGRRSPKR